MCEHRSVQHTLQLGPRAAWGAAGLEMVSEIAGITKPVDIEAHGFPGPQGALRVVGNKELRMSDFGVKPPVLMLGAIKTDDRIEVRFDLRLARSNPS